MGPNVILGRYKDCQDLVPTWHLQTVHILYLYLLSSDEKSLFPCWAVLE